MSVLCVCVCVFVVVCVRPYPCLCAQGWSRSIFESEIVFGCVCVYLWVSLGGVWVSILGCVGESCVSEWVCVLSYCRYSEC